MNRNKPATVFLALAVLALQPPVSLCHAAESPVVLTVRPEHLQEANRHYSYPPTLRNPFSWPIDQENQDLAARELDAETRALRDKIFSSLHLEAILWNPASPLAVINGQLVKTNDAVNDVTILRIDKDTVTVNKGRLSQMLEFTRPPSGLETHPLPE